MWGQWSQQQRGAALLLLLSSRSAADSSDSSNESESESDEDAAFVAAMVEEKGEPSGRSWSGVWWREVVPELNEAEYKAQFRLSRSSFTALCASLDAQWVRPGQEGRPPMATDKAVAITLWRLANTVTYREVAEQFGEQRQTVQKVCRRVMELICSVHSALIRAPSTRREWVHWRSCEDSGRPQPSWPTPSELWMAHTFACCIHRMQKGGTTRTARSTPA